MRKVNAFVLLLIFIIIQSGTAVVAHPEAIEKKTVELSTDTIIVAEKSVDGSSGYTITNIASDGTTGSVSYSMYNMLNSKNKGTSAVLKVDISSVKYASDFNLRFSFKSGGCVGNCLRAYCISYKFGEELVAALAEMLFLWQNKVLKFGDLICHSTALSKPKKKQKNKV